MSVLTYIKACVITRGCRVAMLYCYTAMGAITSVVDQCNNMD